MSAVNPYATPKAEVRDLEPINSRPGWVWAIFIYYLFSAGSTVISYSLMWSGVIEVPEAPQHYLAKLTAVDYALSLLTGSINLIAAVLLFRLRKISFHFFVSALLLSLLVTAWNATQNGLFNLLGGMAFITIPIGFGIKAAICFYAWRLIKVGILK